jgi:hypothetical protein
VDRVASGGTVNAVYRLGAELSVRLPLTAGGVDALAWEVIQLPYYRNTNPIISANARHVLREVLAS